MTLDMNNIVVRLVVAFFIYFFFNILIDTLVKDPKANETFKIVLLIVCLLIIFAVGFIVKL